jgi:hypothetical protein
VFSIKVFLEVATLDISTHLAVTLDGGVAVFPTTTTVDFLPEVRCRVACYHCAMLRWRARIWQHWGFLRHGWRARRGRNTRLLRRWLAPHLSMWCVDGGDDELIDVMTPPRAMLRTEATC